MIDKLMKGFVDFIYGVGRVRSKYLRENPDEQILAADGSKGIRTKGDQQIERGLDWVISQRAVVLLTDRRIKCGNWDIPIQTIETAKLLKIPSLFGSGQLLKIQTKDNRHFQFGMQANPEWTNQNILPLILEQGQVKTSLFSLLLRVIVVGYIIYWLLQRFQII